MKCVQFSYFMNEFTSAWNLNTLWKEDRIAFGIPTERCDYIYYNECLSFSILHCKKGFYLGERLKKGHGSLWGGGGGVERWMRLTNTQQSFFRRFDIWILIMLVSRVLLEAPTSGRIPDINFINLGNNNINQTLRSKNQGEATCESRGGIFRFRAVRIPEFILTFLTWTNGEHSL